MTDTVDQALSDVALGLLRADAGLTVFDGVVSNPTPDVKTTPWVLVYSHVQWMYGAADALDGVAGSATVRWICHCVGGSEVAARALAQRVRTQLLNVRPVLTGYPQLSLGLIRQESSSPPTRDEITGQPVMDAVVVYRLEATT